MRILLKVSYDGTAYHGWQMQPGEPETIEGRLNRCLTELTGAQTEVIGCSRTDAGVHSKGNICVFDTSSGIPPERYVPALNGILPTDIRVLDSFRVDDCFHPRHTDTRKTYCYRFYHGDICPPFERLYRHHVYGPIDTNAMQRAASAFKGEHDFAAFCAAGSQAETTVRTIYDVVIKRTAADPLSEYIDIYITGGGFLYNMVRIIAGTLLEVGRGRIGPEDIQDVIDSRDRSRTGPTLPACGLTLERIDFDEGIPAV